MTSDTTICSLKLSKFAEGLVPEEKKLYCDFLKELGCVDPLTIPLSVYKSEKKVKEVLPPIKNKHLVLYLVIERNGSDGEKFEAYKNLNGSPQYVDNTFADKLLAFPLPNGIVINRSHIRVWKLKKTTGISILLFINCRNTTNTTHSCISHFL